MTERQARFVGAFIETSNASEAARRAGYSARRAGEIGHQLLQKTTIAAEIAKLRAKKMAEIHVSIETLLLGYARIAYSDAGKLFDENGKLLPIRQLDDDTRLAIASVEVVERPNGDVVKKVKFWNKLQAQDALSRHLGLFRVGADADLRTPERQAKLRDCIHALSPQQRTQLEAILNTIDAAAKAEAEKTMIEHEGNDDEGDNSIAT